MSATGLSPETATALAANLKVLQAELEVFSAATVFSAAYERLRTARAEAAVAQDLARCRPEVMGIVETFRQSVPRTCDMRTMLDDLEGAGFLS